MQAQVLARSPLVQEPARPSYLELVDSKALPEALTHRDPATFDRIARFLSPLVTRWYRPEVEGVQHLRSDSCMYVATHNGSYHMPDAYALYLAFWRRFGPRAPLFGLTHGAVLRVTVVAPLLEKVGAVPASPENGALVLRHGFPLMVCPGGDADALKPFTRRHEIRWQGRGYIRLALREQVPIIPAVSVGAHETLLVLNEGRKTAKLLRFDKIFRIKAVPLALSFPFGLTPAGIFSLPLPTKVRVRVLPAIDLDEPPEAADDPERVEACFQRVRLAMQDAIDSMAAERRWPVLG